VILFISHTSCSNEDSGVSRRWPAGAFYAFSGADILEDRVGLDESGDAGAGPTDDPSDEMWKWGPDDKLPAQIMKGL
jgi:hypothetical protein